MSRCRPFWLALALLAVTFEIPMSEFLELQSLPTEARRARLNLPETCEPAMTAVSGAARRGSGRLLILVTCRGDAENDVPWTQGRSGQAPLTSASSHRSENR